MSFFSILQLKFNEYSSNNGVYPIKQTRDEGNIGNKE